MNWKDVFRTEPGQPPSHLAITLARNLKRLRGRRGYSLEQLARRSGIDTPDLADIEAGAGQPSLSLAWRVARALAVPFTALIADQAPRGAVVVRYGKAPAFASGSLGLSTRALVPHDETRGVEFYEVTLAPHWEEKCEPHAPGTTESLHVGEGAIALRLGREDVHFAGKGDTITFPADLPHDYRNLGPTPARLYLVMTYEASSRDDPAPQP